MHLCLFEDSRAANFHPLAYLRPVYGLRCGLVTMAERITSYFPRATVDLHVRPYLADLLREDYPSHRVNELPERDTLFINGRAMLSTPAAKSMRAAKSDVVFVAGGQTVGAFLFAQTIAGNPDRLAHDAANFDDLIHVPRVEVQATFMEYPWDLLYANENAIENDFARLPFNGKSRQGNVHRTAVLLHPADIRIGKNAHIDPLVVLDATHGPIVIGEGATIHAHTYVEGPCAIGAGSSIKPGSQILACTSLGPVCRVGGEVSHSILQEYANKQHHGFLGHAYLGAWVNLGAGTTNSNLKNTYGSIRVKVNGIAVETGKMFLGLTAGDHVKTGINATVDTGTVIGISSNVYGTRLLPKYVPPFTWGEAGALTTYDIDKALVVARTVMLRRQRTLTAAYAVAFRSVFAKTTDERNSSR